MRALLFVLVLVLVLVACGDPSGSPANSPGSIDASLDAPSDAAVGGLTRSVVLRATGDGVAGISFGMAPTPFYSLVGICGDALRLTGRTTSHFVVEAAAVRIVGPATVSLDTFQQMELRLQSRTERGARRVLLAGFSTQTFGAPPRPWGAGPLAMTIITPSLDAIAQDLCADSVDCQAVAFGEQSTPPSFTASLEVTLTLRPVP